MQKTKMDELYYCLLANMDTKMLSNYFWIVYTVMPQKRPKINVARFARTCCKMRPFLSGFGVDFGNAKSGLDANVLLGRRIMLMI